MIRPAHSVMGIRTREIDSQIMITCACSNVGAWPDILVPTTEHHVDAPPAPPVAPPPAAPPAPPGPLGLLAPPPRAACAAPLGRLSTRVAPPCAAAAPWILLTILSAGLFCSVAPVAADESGISPSSGAGRLSDCEGDVGAAGVCERVALTAVSHVSSTSRGKIRSR